MIASGHGLSDPGNRRLVGVFCLVPRVYGLISVISIWRQARGFCFERWGNPRHLFFLERVSLKDLLCYSLLRILFGEHGRSLHCCIDHSDRCPRSVLRPSKLTVAAIRVLSHWVQQIRHLWLATASRLRVHRPQCRCAHSRLERLACGVRWGTKALTSAAARFSFTASPNVVCRSWNLES